MIVICDFDGTLTPFGIPKYKILEDIGYNGDKLLKRVMDLIKKDGLSLYEAFYKTYEDILKENKVEMSYDNVVLGAKDITFNPGVLSYFEELSEKNSGIKHFIVTSGFEDYVRSTRICDLVNGIYGTTYHKEKDIFTKVNRIITDEEKPNVIDMIVLENPGKKVIYVGDGLTDKSAFQAVHNLGGKCIFVGSEEQDYENYKKLKAMGIVDEYFLRDFTNGSPFRKFIEKENKINNNIK